MVFFGDVFGENGIGVKGGQYLERNSNQVKFFLQGLPSGGVGGLQQGDVDAEGVVDREAFDERGTDMLGVLIVAIQFTYLAGGEEARPPPDDGDGGDGQEGGQEHYEQTAFH